LGALQGPPLPVFNYIRFSFAQHAITGNVLYGGTGAMAMTNCQFVDCVDPFYMNYSSTNAGPFPFLFYNVLYTQSGSAVAGLVTTGSVSVNAVNVTADRMGTFMDMGVRSGASVSCFVTNSLFTDVTNFSDVSLSATLISCGSNATASGFYTNVGAASFYLPYQSTNQGAGGTNIDPALFTNLQTKTTWPPVVEPVGLFTNNCMFSAQVPRDTNGTDRGYHYDPIDYAVCLKLSNATVTVTPGTVLAGYSTNTANYGIWLIRMPRSIAKGLP
jgi:hypothetical protein